MTTIQTFKTKLVLRTKKKNGRGEAPIAVRIHLPHKSKAKYEFYTTNIRIKEGEWDAEKEEVINKGKTENQRLNISLQRTIVGINDHLNREQALGNTEPENIAAALKGRNVVRAEFFAFAQKHFEGMTAISDTTRELYLRHLNSFKDFYKKDKLPFRDANTELFKDYINHQEKGGASVSSISIRIFVIKSVMTSAINKGIVPNKNFINKELRLSSRDKRQNEGETIKYLTSKELDKIITLPLHENKTIQAYRDTFVLSATTGGLSWANVIALKWDNIKYCPNREQYFLENLTRQKTGANLPKLIIGPKAIQLLERYGKLGESKGFIFFKVFKIDEAKYKDKKTQKAIVRSVGDKCTRYLNRLSNNIERAEGLTFHQARHSWATIALSKGISIEIVSKILGHKKISTTQIYAQINEDASLQAQMKIFEEFDKPKQQSEN
jgi:integrase/recombinase XerD